MFSSLTNFFTNTSKKKSSQSEENNHSFSNSTESLLVQSTKKNPQLDDQSRTDASPQTNLQFSEDDVKNVLQDFEKLDYNDSKCFNKIAEKYKKERDLFDYVVLSKQKEIINILDNKLPDLKRQEEFRKRLGEYIYSRIKDGMSYGENLQSTLQFLKGRAEEVLSDFKNLRFDFKDNKCEDPNDYVNYNSGRPADPFDKIANYYRRKRDIFLFNYAILSQQKEIMNILDKKFTNEDQKKNFENRLGRYLIRIEEGMNDAKEFLKEDGLVGFFDGRYWPGENAEVNHYDNLSVNIIKPEKSLETSRLFTDKIERMERNKNEVKRAKIYSDGKLIVTIEKNDKQQRNYRFAKDATCDMKIRWSEEDEKGNSVDCFISLNANPSNIEIGQVTINGKDVQVREILELAKQNKDMLIENQALYEFLEECLENVLCEEEKNIQPQEKEVVTTPSSILHDVELDEISEEEAIKKGWTPGYFGS
ncbi:hypothetical protein [Wolbachia endosymbiont (group B) of Ochlodes sylvanus]|uniref:hypothetical protein n=1 Tax=Wolbachia endosymbiont (group B) of Ochlodes sylvanus TaxID=2954035 RepID=UPI00221EFE23|nr:hypothetical protein [Wolbachia endosymbiont (group B) of Ochlodes sylvanus]